MSWLRYWLVRALRSRRPVCWVVSLRQAQRLLVRYRDGGGGELIHKSRGRPASNKMGNGIRELVLELVRQNYRDFGATLAAEVLLERHGIEVSRETLRKWMVEVAISK